MTCDRCGKESLGYTCSMFNTDEICFDCKDREEAHPKYAEARDRELEAVKSGDFNYRGIGLPSDLR